MNENRRKALELLDELAILTQASLASMVELPKAPAPAVPAPLAPTQAPAPRQNVRATTHSPQYAPALQDPAVVEALLALRSTEKSKLPKRKPTLRPLQNHTAIFKAKK